MRTDEEIILAVHARAEAMRRKGRRNKVLLLGGSATACALTLLALLIARMSSLREQITRSGATTMMQASILADSGVLDYAVVGIVAFLLGVAVTLFCLLLRKWRDGEEKLNDRNR